jgi:putative ABC transport system permease protein
MRGLFLLARRSLAYHRGRSIVVTCCIALSIALPVSVRLMVVRFQDQVTARAGQTPLVIGARGSRFDLALHAMYFNAQPPFSITIRELGQLEDAGVAQSIPLFIAHQARQKQVVGTRGSYFSFRQLSLQAGEHWERLGDCVLGSTVARQLELVPGDRLLTDPQDPFNLVGVPPLKMRVTGVLAESHSPDDNVVFVSLETAWVIEGIGHGHRADSGDGPSGSGEAVMPFTEITDANLGQFHFHGAAETFPLTAILAVAADQREATLLEASYLDPEGTAQLLRPDDVVAELMAMVFQVQQFFDMLAMVLVGTTGLLVGLVVVLSLRLRAREMATMVKLGCSRHTVFWLQAMELVILSMAGLVVALLLVLLAQALLPQAVEQWMVASTMSVNPRG